MKWKTNAQKRTRGLPTIMARKVKVWNGKEEERQQPALYDDHPK